MPPFNLSKYVISFTTLGYPYFINEKKALILFNPSNYFISLPSTVEENIIATTKIRNNYGAIQSFIFPILR